MSGNPLIKGIQDRKNYTEKLFPGFRLSDWIPKENLYRGLRETLDLGLGKKYDIELILSNGGLNFKVLHTKIHEIKSWIRSTYSWVSDFNVYRYFDEFCCRLNRSQSKRPIFNNLIVQIV